ncbi:MAG: hypothetical protein A2096_16785 [Spirochaetes bacterium GWF1_41_5]|nr:MAG: hypothetical protein A2096_16785 [Spirochaetes bacterium GWF1_41_5]
MIFPVKHKPLLIAMFFIAVFLLALFHVSISRQKEKVDYAINELNRTFNKAFYNLLLDAQETTRLLAYDLAEYYRNPDENINKEFIEKKIREISGNREKKTEYVRIIHAAGNRPDFNIWPESNFYFPGHFTMQAGEYRLQFDGLIFSSNKLFFVMAKPVEQNTNFLSLLELSFNLDYFNRHLSELFQFSSAVLVRRSLGISNTVKAWGDYNFLYSCKNPAVQQLSKIFSARQDLGSAPVVTLGSEKCCVRTVKICSAAGDVPVIMIFAGNITEIFNAYRRYRYILVGIMIIFFVIIFLVLHASFSSLLGKIENMNKNLQNRVESEVSANRKKDHIMFHQARQASLGEMIAAVCHQWKQPLTALNLVFFNLEYSLRSGESGGKALEAYFHSGKKYVENMSESLDLFRNFYQPAETAAEFDIAAAVKKLAALFDYSLQKSGIAVEINCAENIRISGYESEFSQALLNIVMNARDALNAVRRENGRIGIEIVRKKNCIEITVTDNGGGIPAAVLPELFKPYFTTKKNEGTGLGLYISKIIIENKMRGTIRAGNSENGAEFIISLPIPEQV